MKIYEILFLLYFHLKRIPNLKTKIFLIKSILSDKLTFFKRKKYNYILENSNISESFFKKYLKEYYNCSKEISNIFLSKKIFFFSLNGSIKNEILDLINSKFPNFKNRLIIEADKILNNCFTIFEKTYKFNNKINWNYSFFNNKNWPYLPSSEINYDFSFFNYLRSSEIESENYSKIGDIKYNWEFNRHSFLVTLGLAYYFTGNDDYSNKIIELILDWIKKNLPRYSTNWMYSLEISMRLISWIFSLSLIKDSPKFSDNLFYKIFKSIFQQAFYLSINGKKYLLNHTIGRYFGLFLFSYIFKEINIVKKWYNNSIYQIKKQILRQTLLDGVNIERSLNYHRYVLEYFSLFLIITPNSLSKYEKALINKMYTFLMSIIKPNNSIPLVGDFDDARVIPSIFYNKNENYHYYQELLSLGSILFKRGDLKYLSEQISPMPILLLGKNGYHQFKKIKKKKPKENYYYFKHSGYFIAKNGYQHDSNFFFFDLAEIIPFGAHDHFDISNIIYSYKGKPILVDSGTYRYNIPLKLRKIFKNVKAHNILKISEPKRMERNFIFGWYKIPKIERRCIDKKQNYSFECKHNYFKNFLTSRRITTSKDLENIEIFDIVKPKKKINKEIKINLYFHFNKDIQLEIKKNEILINNILKLVVKDDPNLRFTIIKQKYFFSPMYGIRFLAPMINIKFSYKFNKKKPLQIKTHIIPLN